MRIPSPNSGLYYFIVYAVHADISSLVVLADLKAHSLLLIYVHDVQEQRKYRCKIPIRCKNGHSVLEYEYTEIFYSRRKLEKLQLHFIHCNIDKLFQLLRRTQLLTTNHELKRILQVISHACYQYRKLSVKLFRLRASFLPVYLICN